MKNQLFVYGTLQINEIVTRVIGRELKSLEAILPGYRRGIVERANFPGIVPDANGQVFGQVLSPVSATDFVKLDKYEGELYQRVLVTVQLTNAESIRCWVYAMQRWAVKRVSEQDWSLDWYLTHASRGRLTYRQ